MNYSVTILIDLESSEDVRRQLLYYVNHDRYSGSKNSRSRIFVKLFKAYPLSYVSEFKAIAMRSGEREDTKR